MFRNRKAMAYFLRKAREDKAWAERTRNDSAWIAGASETSKKMLAENLGLTVEQLAERSYDYELMRARAKGKYYGSSVYIDPGARDLWKKITGRYPSEGVLE